MVSVDQDIRYTYSQFYPKTEIIAKALLAQGIQTGDRVGIWSANRAEWVLLQFAIARIGVILVTIYPAYRINELAYVVNQSEIKALFASKQYKSSQYQDMIEKVRPECSTLEHVYIFENGWKEFLAHSDKVNTSKLNFIEQSVQFDDPVNIQYTSGTTGFPKGVTLTHHNILNNGYFIGIRLNYTFRDRVCIPVPFYHCFGMVIGNLACVSHGACMVLPSDNFDAAKTLKAVQEEKCTSLYGVPTMFIAELDLPNDLSTLRTGVMAGSPCSIEIMKKYNS